MNVKRFEPDEFYRLAQSMLLRREAENNFIIGLTQTLRLESSNPDHLFLIAFDESDPMAAAVQTPPHPLILTRGSDAAMDALTEFIIKNNVQIPGVGGPVDSATRVATAVSNERGQTLRLRTKMRIFQIDHVIVPRSSGGSGRFADENDLPLLLEWMEAFSHAISEPNPDLRANVSRRLNNKNYFLWSDPHPVSIAGWAGPTPNGVRINSVFTPPNLRGRGYASNCVAALTQHLLNQGKQFCFLYTDRANPTSNKIYQQIGYNPVCDWADFRFG
jgi:predicted GNAT family acetyltransferase